MKPLTLRIPDWFKGTQVDPKTLAGWLGISVARLFELSGKGKLPKPTKRSNKPAFWDLKKLKKAIEQQSFPGLVSAEQMGGGES